MIKPPAGTGGFIYQSIFNGESRENLKNPKKNYFKVSTAFSSQERP
jgi:hypothetical protein